MTVNAAIIISLITLILVVIGHIFVMARWSGRVDANLEAILRQPAAWNQDLSNTATALRTEISTQVASFRGELAIYVEETKKLREARHIADGIIQRHEGKFQNYDRAIARLETFMDEHEHK